MLIGLGAAGSALGIAVATAAAFVPRHSAVIEKWAGALLVLGVGLLGLAFQMP